VFEKVKHVLECPHLPACAISAEAKLVNWSYLPPLKRAKSLFEPPRLLTYCRPKPVVADSAASCSRRPKSTQAAAIAHSVLVKTSVSWHDRLVLEKTEEISMAASVRHAHQPKSTVRESSPSLTRKDRSRLEPSTLARGVPAETSTR
jgi:hypothetical protein